MRCVREILRLKHERGASDRAIARSTGLARSTVSDYPGASAAAGLGWPLPATLTDAVLEALLFAKAGAPPGTRRKAEPDWPAIHRELRRAGVTLMLLWQEYRAREPQGYGYSRFCEMYRAWEHRLSPTMRQGHPAGERLFVDYAGQTVDLIDGAPARCSQAQIFVAVLGASSYTYAEASWTQTAAGLDRRACPGARLHRRRAAQIVPDNLKAGVLRPTGTSPASIRPTRIWPRITARRSCRRGRASRATRPRSRPACWWSSAGSWPSCATSASSRSPSSTSRIALLAELNRGRCAISASAGGGSSRSSTARRSGRCRASPRLRRMAAPSGRARLPLRIVDGHYYRSASPDEGADRGAHHRIARSSCSARASVSPAMSAAAAAAGTPRCPSTCRARTAVMPAGRSTGSIATPLRSARHRHARSSILESRPHPEQGYRACLGILRLARQYGAARLEAACDRGLDIGARSYGSIHSILKTGSTAMARSW